MSDIARVGTEACSTTPPECNTLPWHEALFVHRIWLYGIAQLPGGGDTAASRPQHAAAPRQSGPAERMGSIAHIRAPPCAKTNSRPLARSRKGCGASKRISDASEAPVHEPTARDASKCVVPEVVLPTPPAASPPPIAPSHVSERGRRRRPPPSGASATAM